MSATITVERCSECPFNYDTIACHGRGLDRENEAPHPFWQDEHGGKAFPEGCPLVESSGVMVKVAP